MSLTEPEECLQRPAEIVKATGAELQLVQEVPHVRRSELPDLDIERPCKVIEPVTKIIEIEL